MTFDSGIERETIIGKAGLFTGRHATTPVSEVGIEEFGGRVLGFFTSRPSKTKREKLFRPLFMSKVILELKVSPMRESGKQEPGMKTFVVDYDGKFFLTPLKIKKDT